MHHQVTVTLTAITGNFTPRTLLLTPSEDTTLIGRSSRSVAKGIVGAEDNAWFDSPVMSRDHAQLRLDSSTSTVTIHDRASMHGTFLNDKKLEQMKDVVVNKGDVLVFGAEVKRGVEVFTACSFKVDLVFAPHNSGNTFSAPDSDIEDDDEEIYGSSDIDKDERNQVSSVDGVSVESPSAADQIACPQPIKVMCSIHAIDLTGDESPIDLRSPSPDFQAMEATRAPSTNVDRAAQHGGYTYFEIARQVVVDSEEDCSDLDDRSDVALSDSSNDLEASDDSFSEGSMELDGEDAEEMSESSDSDDANDDHDSFSEQDLDSSAIPFATYPQCVGGPVKTQNYAAGSEDFMDSDDNDEDDVHNLGPSGEINESTGALPNEPANEHLPGKADRVLAEHDRDVACQLLSNNHLDSLGRTLHGRAAALMKETTYDKVFSVNVSGELTPAADEDSKVSEAESMCPPLIPISEKFREYPFRRISTSPPDNILSKVLSYQRGSLGASLAARQPSPSDAAMVKTPPPRSIEQVAFFKPLDHNKVSQALGDKTGKHAFFEAREKNKATLASENEIQSQSSFSPLESGTRMTLRRASGKYRPTLPSETEMKLQSSFSPLESETQMGSKRASGEFLEFLTKRNNNTFGAPKFSPSEANKVSGSYNRVSEAKRLFQFPYGMHYWGADESLLVLPQASSARLERATSPEYDMTSADSFDESKARSIRSRVSIHDIIENSPRAPSPPKSETKAGSKRKADDISDSIQEEFRAWASSPDRSSVDTVTNITTIIQEERPTKKLKTVLDRVAYAAVGGFAVGATLFFGLVATAPNFA